MNDPSTNAANLETVLSADERAHDRIRKLDNALAAVLNTKEGRTFLGHLLYDADCCHVNHRSIDPSEAITAMREGERNIGNKLLAWIESLSFEARQLIELERHQAAKNEVLLMEAERKIKETDTANDPILPYDGPVV